MKRIPRVLFISALLALSLPLAACESMDNLPSLDPSDLFSADFFNTKKKLPGERKPVFPEGVPGVARGVPPELVKGNQQQADLSETPENAVPVEPKPKAKPKPKPRVAARPAPPPDEPPPQQARPSSVSIRPTPTGPTGPAQATPWPDPPPSAPRGAAPPAASSPGQIMWPEPPAPSR
jgi:hypothetical protein